MSAEDLFALTRHFLEQRGVEHGVHDDEHVLVIGTVNDEPMFISFFELDVESASWPGISLEIPLLEGVEGLPSDVVAELNSDLVVGKLALDDGTLALQHEMLGWPGAVEYDRTIDLLARQCPEMREGLAGKAFGTPFTPYSTMQNEWS